MFLLKKAHVFNYLKIIDLDFEITQSMNLFLVYINNTSIFMGELRWNF